MKLDWTTPEGLEMVEPIDPLGNRALYEAHSYPKLQGISSMKKLEIDESLLELEKIKDS